MMQNLPDNEASAQRAGSFGKVIPSFGSSRFHNESGLFFPVSFSQQPPRLRRVGLKAGTNRWVVFVLDLAGINHVSQQARGCLVRRMRHRKKPFADPFCQETIATQEIKGAPLQALKSVQMRFGIRLAEKILGERRKLGAIVPPKAG